MSRRWVVFLGIGVLVLAVIVAVVIGILADRSRDEARRAAAAASTTGFPSPYDLTELPDDSDLDAVDDASFVSLSIPDAEGRLTSYGLSTDLATTQALLEAVRGAEELGADATAGTDSTVAGDPGTGPTMTFVLPTRETLTFALDLEEGTISRGGRTWRPRGDLAALVSAAAAHP